MKEDFSPYMIPNSSAYYESQHMHKTKRQLTSCQKTYVAKSSPRQAKELQTLLTSATAKYVSNFKVDPKIPYAVHHGFERDMEFFPQNLASQVSKNYVDAIDRGVATGKALTSAYSEVKEGMRTLTAKLNSYDREFSSWLALESLQNQDYTRYLFISEQDSNTCDSCLSYHGKVFSLTDVPILPLHSHCRCELLVMDTRMEALYHLNEHAFIERFRQLRGDTEGGVYLIDHQAFPFGISPSSLTRVSLPRQHTITDRSLPERSDSSNDYDLLSATTAYLANLADDAKDLISHLLNAQAIRGEHKWDNFGNFMDWLTLGIVSGTWRGISSNFHTMISDPSLYNIVNFITLGTLDSLSGALSPEAPWSLEHWLDIVGTILTTYAAYKVAVNAKNILTGSTDDAMRAGGSLADDIGNTVRNAGLTQSQIDDIVNIPKGQRPDPSTYLTQEYIDQHLDMFRGGATKFYAKAPVGTVGPPEGTFVMPSSVADDLIKQANGDVRALEELLGFDPGYLGNSPVRIDISNPNGLRIPSGNELGSNDYWLPGGYTSGGIPEAIINQPQLGDYAVNPAF